MKNSKVNIHANWIAAGGILLTIGVAVSGCARSDGGAPVYYGGKAAESGASTPIVTSSVTPPASASHKPVTAIQTTSTGTSAGGRVIQVGQGDTIYYISRKYNIYPSELVRENDLQPPYRLSPGQSLRLPANAHLSNDRSSAVETSTPVTVASARETAGTVNVTNVRIQRGDTLYGIARAHGLSPRELASYNGLSQPYVLHPGQTLRIPHTNGGADTNAVASAAPTPVAQHASARTTLVSRATNQSTVIVGKGDTLYGIARSNGISVAQLESWNGIDDAGALQLGQTLFLSDRSNIGEGGPDKDEPIASASSAPSGQAEIIAEAVTPKPQIEAPQSTGQSDSPKATSTVTPVETASLPKVEPEQGEQKKEAATPIVTSSLGSAGLGAAKGKDGFIMPVRGGKIISTYGPKENGLYNDGINIAVQDGTPVRAAKSGIVTYAGEELQGYGKLLLIKHEDGYVTAYAHNSRLLVREGDHVRQGDVIAESGHTGEVAQPQLHFQIRKGRKSIDPQSFFSQMG